MQKYGKSKFRLSVLNKKGVIVVGAANAIMDNLKL